MRRSRAAGEHARPPSRPNAAVGWWTYGRTRPPRYLVRARGAPSAVAAAAVLLFCAAPAGANGRFPASNQIVFSPSNPSLVVARTTYAILPSTDDGATWSYLCEESLGLASTAYQDPELGLTAKNALVAGLLFPVGGLDVSANLGCDWRCVGGPLADQGVADVVVRPDRASSVLALTSTYVRIDAGGGTLSQIFESADDGATWNAKGAAIDATFLVQTIDVAATDPHRIYVSGTRGYGATRSAALLVSTDDGASWTERPVTAFDPMAEDSVYIGAVDPSDADRVYVRSSARARGGTSRLFVTGSAGASFDVALQLQIPAPAVVSSAGEILGFALSPDGSKIYAGTKAAGLFMANKSDMTFVKTSSIHVQCLATRGAELWACSDEVSGFVVGTSTNDGATFTAKLTTITGLEGTMACAAPNGTLACGATSNGSECAAPFTMFCQNNDPTGQCKGAASDAGAANGGAMKESGANDPDAANGAATRTSDRAGGCSASGSRPGAGSAASLLLLAAFGRARPRKRRSSG